MRRWLGSVSLVVIAGVVLAVLGLLVAPGAFAESAENIRGQLRDPDRVGVPGVTVTVTQDGTEVGTATSNAEGEWEVPLPGPGNYDVALDPKTLPKDLAADGEGKLVGVPVRGGEQKNVILRIVAKGGEGTGGEGQPAGEGGAGEDEGPTYSPEVQRVAQRILDGIKYGAIIAITAVGLSLIFGTTGLINFAHGELVTVGAMTAFFLSAAVIGPGVALIPAALLAVVLGGAYGWLVDRGMWRPLRGRGTGLIQMFIIMIGLSLVLRHLTLLLFGSRRKPYREFALQQEWQLGPIAITPRDLVIMVVSFAVLAAVGLMLTTTRIGKAMRAVSDNRDLAEASGIDVPRVVMVVWILSGSLAALGGVFYGLTEILSWDMGFQLLLLMFAAVILGGLGTAYGAMAGGLVIGLVAQLSTLWFSTELEKAWALLILIFVLLVRPRGILGRAERVG